MRGIASRKGISRVTSCQVSTGQRRCEGSRVPVGDQVVLAAWSTAVDQRRAGVRSSLRALPCQPSSMSSRPVLRSSGRRDLVQAVASDTRLSETCRTPLTVGPTVKPPSESHSEVIR